MTTTAVDVSRLSVDQYAAAWAAPMTDPQRALFYAEFAQVRRDPKTGLLFALFLGGLGIHRFYLRDLTGIAYVIFCWTFIPAIVALLECFLMEARIDAYNKTQAALIATRINAYASTRIPA